MFDNLYMYLHSIHIPINFINRKLLNTFKFQLLYKIIQKVNINIMQHRNVLQNVYSKMSI